MICYKDMTFCSFYESCTYANTCMRPLTKAVIDDAESLGLPISRFVEPPACHSCHESESID